MFKYQNIIAGFILIISLLAIIGGSSIFLLRDIARNADDIYNHPFIVSNAAKNIKFHLNSMHQNMKDVVLAENYKEITSAIDQMQSHELSVLSNFDIISERFLGKKLQIDETYQLFLNWKPIRNEVIKLVTANHINDAAIIIKGSGANYVKKLNKQVENLVKFAQKKVEEFKNNADDNESRAIVILISLCIFAVFAALIIAFLVLKNLVKNSKNMSQRKHLIDQNIMMASLDLNGKIIDISNALCRFLKCIKKDLIGTESGFFDNSADMEQSQEYIWQVINTGKSWHGEIRHIDYDGKSYWASSSILPIFNDNFELTGFNNILTDITSKKLSITDNLTTLFNRRQYEEIIRREIRLAKRNGTSLTLAIADIDFFKNYNDNYGHPMGDKALNIVAKKMLNVMKRPNDYVFRIGGEEFAFIFSNLNCNESNAFLDEIRQSIEILKIPHEFSKASKYLTLSIGAHVALENKTISEEEIYIMADKALYIAKEKRNNVIVTS